MSRPLEGLTVLEFSQFLSGPYAGLRLSDLGARVIKIERPEVGDLCRTLYISDTDLEGDSTLFHAINRNKESFAANLKDPKDIAKFFIDNGAKNCVFTMGAEGSVFISKDEYIKTPAFDIEVKDTTGCGDAFDAGMITALAKDFVSAGSATGLSLLTWG